MIIDDHRLIRTKPLIIAAKVMISPSKKIAVAAEGVALAVRPSFTTNKRF